MKLKGADKVLEENQKLKQLNGRLSHSIQVTKAEADEATKSTDGRSSQEAQRTFLAKTSQLISNQSKGSERTRDKTS